MSQIDLLARNEAGGNGSSPKKRSVGPFWIHAGNQTIDPATAARALSECALGIQKHRTDSGSLHIKRFAEALKRGFWTDFSQISFGVTPDGRHYLLNGYHRLSALVEFGRPALFNVVTIECADEKEVLSWYARFDRPTLVRMRSDADAMNAIGFASSLGVSRNVARSLWRAIPIILNGMKPVRLGDIKIKVEMSVLEVRAEAAMAWKKEIALYDAVIASVVGETFRRKLMSPSVVAVALQTIRHAETKAVEFWTAVAKNDGLRAGTPAHTLVRTLMDRTFRGGDEDNLIVPALAWNALYEGRKLSIIKAGAAGPLRIAGTPVGRGERR